MSRVKRSICRPVAARWQRSGESAPDFTAIIAYCETFRHIHDHRGYLAPALQLGRRRENYDGFEFCEEESSESLDDGESAGSTYVTENTAI
jgi:hypothetical protein